MILKYRHSLYFLLTIQFFVWSLEPILSQNSKLIEYEGVPKKYIPKGERIDSLGAYRVSIRIVNKMRLDGYWTANVDTVAHTPDRIKVSIYQGNRFEDISLELSSEDSLYQLTNYKLKKSKSITTFRENLEELLAYFETNGYPFVSLVVDSAVLNEQRLNIKVKVESGMKIVFDTVSVAPTGILKDKFLNKYLNLDVNKLYDESAVKAIPDRLQNLEFVSLVELSNSFQLKKSKINIHLKPVKVNYFDGIIGFVPNSEDGKLEVTGELNLSVKNLFQSAKAVEVHWQKMAKNTQKLNASYYHPIFLGTPLDLFGSFDQIKQDTLFSNRKLNVGFSYYPLAKLKLSSFYENFLGNELNDETGQSGNFSIDNYGFSLSNWSIDNRTNPTNGHLLNVNFRVGNKNVDSLDVQFRSTQYAVDVSLDYYLPLMKRTVIYGAINGGLVSNDQLFLNDMYRIGGISSIRGFDEGAFFASRYFYSNLEWRFRMDERSYLMLFYDQAYFDAEITSTTYVDWPSGLGAGMKFNTDNGDFLMVFGMGRRKNEGFSFDSSKIHFGYTALF